MQLTDEQRKQLEDLWFVYGNHGEKHTMSDHKFIQAILERGRYERSLYAPSRECREKVDAVLFKS